MKKTKKTSDELLEDQGLDLNCFDYNLKHGENPPWREQNSFVAARRAGRPN